MIETLFHLRIGSFLMTSAAVSDIHFWRNSIRKFPAGDSCRQTAGIPPNTSKQEKDSAYKTFVSHINTSIWIETRYVFLQLYNEQALPNLSLNYQYLFAVSGSIKGITSANVKADGRGNSSAIYSFPYHTGLAAVSKPVRWEMATPPVPEAQCTTNRRPSQSRPAAMPTCSSSG